MDSFAHRHHRMLQRRFAVHLETQLFECSRGFAKRTLAAGLALLSILFWSALLAEDRVDYAQQIKPIFTKHCVACHGVLKQEAGLRLDTGAFAVRGGDAGAAVTPGDAAASRLIARVTATDPAERMPHDEAPLKPEQIAALRAWIAQGAKSPADEQPERDPREHWAFRPVVRPTVPQLVDSAWVRNPIDAFIAADHGRQGLTPQVEATRSELIRRLYLDLIGVPPSLDELSLIDADSEVGWDERLAKRLLEDPRHGERWARHWMDIWRYSDWWGLGDQLRNSQPHIWHWRDWIVESMNADTPYDEMIRLMLAADELHPNDLDKLRATGFLARNYFLFNRNQWMDETVEHVSKGFLGLTMNCAKCHDHKYDPIEHADYYRLRAFFEPYHVRLDVVPQEADLNRDGIPRVFDGRLDTPTYRFIRGNENQPDKSIPLAPGVPKLLAFRELTINPVTLPPEAWQPERRLWVQEAHVAAAKKNIATAEASLATIKAKLAAATVAVADVEAEERIAELELSVATAELRSVTSRIDAMRAVWSKTDDTTNNAALVEAEKAKVAEAVTAERQVEVAKARRTVANAELRLLRAAADKKEPIEKELKASREALEKAEKQAAAAIVPTDRFTPLVGAKWTPTRFLSSGADDPAVTFGPQSSGRRKALAEWITDRRNPLTARVAVNHLWVRHFGTPLVTTVFDFGRKGIAPAHPELLDWLAAELMESGWSMKHVHRLIVGSASYRMSSSALGQQANVAKDRDNTAGWRRTPIRLEAEVVRDSILSLAGTLDLTRGGPPVKPAEQAESRRRSLYFFHSNNDRNLFLTTFDEATVKECYRREQSIVPQQALAMTNSRLILDASKQIAERIEKATAAGSPDIDDATFARRALTWLLGITASDAELAASLKAFDALRRLPDAQDRDARTFFVWALLNHNDFVTLR